LNSGKILRYPEIILPESSPQMCMKVSGTPESFLQVAGRFLEHQKVSCRLQEVIWIIRKFPADCRK
jgi:hypothetical protein